MAKVEPIKVKVDFKFVEEEEDQDENSYKVFDIKTGLWGVRTRKHKQPWRRSLRRRIYGASRWIADRMADWVDPQETVWNATRPRDKQ